MHFQTHDQHFIDFSFLPLGIGKGYNKESTGLFKKYHHLLVISPFLSRTTVLELDRLSLTNSHKTLITRRSEIPHLTQEMLDSFPCYCLKDTVVDGEEAISESESAMADIQNRIFTPSSILKPNIPNTTFISGRPIVPSVPGMGT